MAEVIYFKLIDSNDSEIGFGFSNNVYTFCYNSITYQVNKFNTFEQATIYFGERDITLQTFELSV